MSQKNLMYVTLWLLVQLLVVEINCQMSAPYKPKTREKHTATLIDNKLYILSGRENNRIDVGKDFFYLEIPDKFNTQNLIWKDLSNIDILPPHYGAAAVKGGVDNNTLILYGGTNDTGAMDLVYTYSLQSNSWSIPKITGDDNLITIRKESLSGIVDNKGKMYLWAGSDDVSKKFHYVNNMLILDTINLNMGKGSSIGAPSGRSLYGATLLSDNTIIYMGGHTDIEQLLTLNPVYLYNTINDSWSTKTTSGKIPSGRVGLSVVPGLDDKRVIIFGGTPFTTDYADLTPEDSIYELSLDNFEWRIPKTSGQIPKSRMFHKANVIGKYMVISFGRGPSLESDILLLDISNNDEYIWTNEFDSSSLPTSPAPPPSSDTTSKPKVPSSEPPSTSSSSGVVPPSSSSRTVMIGAIVGSLFGGAALSFIGFFLYKWNKNRNARNYYNNDEYHGHEIVQPPNDTTNHQPRSAPSSDHQPRGTPASIIIKGGQKSANDKKLTLRELQQEIQDLKQIITQGNKQSTSSIRNN
ncbi:uncharacterized protein OCT59_011273 [Rhizophagus irregularis]|uniref:Galactose oxidase n=2 Tax=Rhizophagus irregularis TaxID=588596 RepID=U9UHR1_RHIID|nr:hypothetical protein GLOIN_2v1779981 [Rhizophagus irregularis DAOM 181602=DAOM 197198]EXX70430.1 Kel2p [Rhizophagus irregularis DAOM 197198w]POG66893.1 hypothetical protein GLOIN_2v1779981 [Rhizophagus irregularis DAOM 181602=DAOM 197198]UZO20012.1 hypothetical protein OCT59_011273 [Rhizophagus irregularis]GBC23706.2 hypothetical protein GLOIN_2v1779981 [Rhizophagus irregularis DAOM 181602=DAOM 197198]|eukprot:XP_025173759.1 hypothetical protein GLOIN_2v1779981 [Rhizophagus irregularis DAOM 181602=DAOM 197198]